MHEMLERAAMCVICELIWLYLNIFDSFWWLTNKPQFCILVTISHVFCCLTTEREKDYMQMRTALLGIRLY